MRTEQNRTVTEVDCLMALQKMEGSIIDLLAIAAILSFAFKSTQAMDLYCLRRMVEENMAELQSRGLMLSDTEKKAATDFLSIMGA